MPNPSEITSQVIFIAKLESSINDLYTTENAFTLISIKIEAAKGISGTQEVLGLLSKHLKRAIINEKDCFSFWNNTFYILTYLDNKEIVETFVNSLALTIEARYDKTFFLKAGYIQYPYDVIDPNNIFEDLKNAVATVNPIKSSFEAGLVADKDYNNVVGKELTRYLGLIKQYGDVLYKHSLCVTKLSVGVARTLNLSNQIIKRIMIAAILHDVGYLCIPQKILVDPTHHNVKTLALVKMHPLLATRKILAEKAVFKEIFQLIEQHHEYLDGTGYPFGFSDEELPLEAQIISIADTYDLIRQQKDITNCEIANFFISKAGIRWDEKLVTIFAGILMDEKQFESIMDFSENGLRDLPL